jgi:signal transduction histidine kinase
MKRLSRFSIFIVLAILLDLYNFPAALFSQKKKSYYRLQPRWIKSHKAILPFDKEQDGVDELFLVSDSQFDLVDIFLNNYDQSFAISGKQKYLVVPIPFGSPDSLFFWANYENEDSSVFKILPPTELTRGKNIDESFLHDFLVFHRHPETPKEIFHNSMLPITVFENSKGEKLALFYYNAAWDTNGVRGILAADLLRFKVIWKYDIGPGVWNVELADLNNDGNLEIIIGTYAHNNGIKGLETKDDSSYVLVLDSNLGQLKWKKAIGPYWTGAWANAGNYKNAFQKDVVVYQFSIGKAISNQDEIKLFDGRTGRLKVAPKYYGQRFTAERILDLKISRDFNNDGKDEFVIGNTDGFVRMFDGNLDILKQSTKYENRILVQAVEDLDRDGQLEIACLIPNDRIVVLDNNLKELCTWKTPIAMRARIIPVHDSEKTYLLYESAFKDGTEYQLLELQTSLVPFEVIASTQKILIGIISAAIFIVIMIWIRNLYLGKRMQQVLPQMLQQANLQDHALIINPDDRIVQVGSVWATLLDLKPSIVIGKKWQQVFTSDEHQSIKSVITEFFQKKRTEASLHIRYNRSESLIPVKIKSFSLRAHCFMLFDLREQEHIRQVKHWAQVAQKLAHGIKNPLTTVKLNAEELLHKIRSKKPINGKEVEEFITPIISQVAKLKKMSDGFMHFVEFEQPDLKPVNMNSEIKELILQWQPEKTKKIQIDWDLEENLPPAMIDQKQFEYAAKNVFYNALESIRDEGKILISTRKVQLFSSDAEVAIVLTFVELQIRDTGCGIPPEFLDRIMLPYFSYNKPDGTGLGLSIVQKIMDSHGGQIDIQSEVNVGTTVSLRFKQANTI